MGVMGKFKTGEGHFGGVIVIVHQLLCDLVENDTSFAEPDDHDGQD